MRSAPLTRPLSANVRRYGGLGCDPASNAQDNGAHRASTKEVIVARKYIDCREFPSEMNCTIAISADSEEELLEAAVQHAVAVHGHNDSREFRIQLREIFKEGTPPLKAASK